MKMMFLEILKTVFDYQNPIKQLFVYYQKPIKNNDFTAKNL
jgi:hypothetical protein